MSHSSAATQSLVSYYSQQYNARASIPDHPEIFSRWQRDSALVRRTHAGLLDVPYGSTIGERLDFYPAHKSSAPLLVFIHGGWWRSLDKSDFTFIVPGYRDAGFNVALTNYTLAPTASIEDITREQLRALAWLYRNAGRYDYDPERIVVAGHSAGGHLAPMMMAAQWDEWSDDLPVDLVKAGVLMSGLFDLEAVSHVDFVADDLQLTAERVNKLSPAWMPQSHPAPFITSVGDLESEEFKRQNQLISESWFENHRHDVLLNDYNHLTICDAFGTPGHPLFESTCELIHSL